MFKLFLAATFVTTINMAAAQSRLAVDNQTLDNLTKPYKTYKLTLVVNDSISNDAALFEIGKELRKHFGFLKSKKLKYKAADFEIRVTIKGQVINQEQYAASGFTTNTGAYTRHSFSLDHLVSSSLSIYNNESQLAFISLDSNSVVRRTYSYVEAQSDYKWANEYDAMRYKQSDMQVAEKNSRKTSELWRFEKDFFYVFANYRNKQ